MKGGQSQSGLAALRAGAAPEGTARRAGRVVPATLAVVGQLMSVWLRDLLEQRTVACRAHTSEEAYHNASGGRIAARRGSLSLDEVNAALMDAVETEFLILCSETVFCRAGVVAPSDSPDLGNPSGSGEGF